MRSWDFAEHDFVGAHAGFRAGETLARSISMPVPAARGHFAGGASEAGGAHVLDGDDGAGLHGFEAGFREEVFFGEGIADLDVGGRFCWDSSVNSAEARSEAPWMPSRPVFAPT